jgi:2,3-bisphosphoglycerate-dependent phosphoglycerate mutase
MKTTLYFIRHAQSRPTSDLHYSQWPLSDRGKEQAMELAPLLGTLGIERLYSSPYIRCLETIRPFVESSRLSLALDHRLGERVISQCLLPDFTEVWNRSWEDFHFALPGCETSAVAQKRFRMGIQQIIERNRGSVVGISSHGNVIGLFLHYLDRSYSRWDAAQIRNPDVFKVVAQAGSLSRDRAFVLPGLDGIATSHHLTPIDFQTIPVDASTQSVSAL